MIGKKIYRLTNLELYDAISSGSDLFSDQELTMELDSRQLSISQRDKLEVDLVRYKKLEQEGRNQPLTAQEYLTLFIFLFLTPKPRWRGDHFSQSEFERYQKYRFSKSMNKQ